MGCEVSSLKAKKKEGNDGKKGKRESHEQISSDKKAKSKKATDSSEGKPEKESLEIPVPKTANVGTTESKHPDRASRTRSATADYLREASYTTGLPGTPSPQRPQSSVWALDELMVDDNSSSSSAPQLFRISPTNRDSAEEGSWRWWMDQVKRDRLTKDGSSRGYLRDVRNHLICQHDDEPTDVELNLGRCYMERTAPYILGKLFSSPTVKEIRWVTSLSLDGNYFTNHGLGNMLATMSEANERRTVMPLLEQLYLNNMNLDHQNVVGIAFYLFPVDFQQEKRSTTPLGPLPEPAVEFAPHTKRPPQVPLFPSLSILSLSDNSGLGPSGLAALFRWLLATHREPHVLSALDLSRCGIDRTAAPLLRQYFAHLPVAITSGGNPVMPRSLVLLGNRHGIHAEADVMAPEEIRLVL